MNLRFLQVGRNHLPTVIEFITKLVNANTYLYIIGTLLISRDDRSFIQIGAGVILLLLYSLYKEKFLCSYFKV